MYTYLEKPHQDANYVNWTDATRAFGVRLMKMPKNYPVFLKTLAEEIAGKELASDLIMQFVITGAIEKDGNSSSFFFVFHEILDSLGWPYR